MQRDWLAARDNCIPYNCEPPREKRMVVYKLTEIGMEHPQLKKNNWKQIFIIIAATFRCAKEFRGEL